MNRKIIVIVCGVVLVGALVSVWFTFRTATVRIPQQEITSTQTGLGQALGEATTKVAPDHGQVVVFTAIPIEQLQQRPNYVWTAFASELQKHSLSITGESVFNAWNTGSQEHDRNVFKELLERHATADALVFFVDLPDWVNVADVFPKSGTPKIIAIDHLQQRMKSRYSGYFANGHLAVLIGSRTDSVPPSHPQTPREWFDRNYQVYTPENYESLPN